MSVSRPLLSVLFAAVATQALAASPALGGYWQAVGSYAAVRPIDGGAAPLTPAAAALKAKNAADPKADPVRACLPSGTPRILYSPQPFQLLQTPKKVVFVYQQNHQFRVVNLGEPFPEDNEPSYFGFSTGHWDGDTLVVESRGIKENTWIDAAGTPHSDALTVTERYRRIPGRRLEARVTLTDPKSFTRPWTMRVVFKPVPGPIQQDVCVDGPNSPIPAPDSAPN